jgi:hypothetical protein
MKVRASSLWMLVGLCSATGCGGVTHTGSGDGGSGNVSGGDGARASVGGSCQSCATDQDCETYCGAPSQPGYRWCCASPTCYSWSSSTCPTSAGGAGGSGAGGANSGGNGTSGGTSGACTGRSSCPNGELCCLRVTGFGGFGGSSGGTAQCQSTCGTGSYQVCQSNADCTMGRTCRMLSGTGGNTVCR